MLSDKGGKEMIKYMELPGYHNCGEVELFSHVYQFVSKTHVECTNYPAVIIIHAYEGATKAFKGVLLRGSRRYMTLPLTDAELEALKPYVGEIQQLDIAEVLAGTTFEAEIKTYRKMTEAEDA